MHEIELKFQIPPAARAAVARAVADAGGRTLPLRAVYLDTAGRRLAAAAFALRLRQEGPRRVQTLKGRGDGVMRRLEHEVELAPDAPFVVDPARHAGTPAGEALQRLLGEPAEALQPVFETAVQREQALLRRADARIELALDIGEVRAGPARWPLHELEFELLEGPVQALLELAAGWVEAHGLWLDPRSKAERGERLARGAVSEPARPWRPAAPGADTHERLAQGLPQALAAAAELIDGHGGPGHRATLAAACAGLAEAVQADGQADGQAGSAAALATLAQHAAEEPAEALAARLAAPPVQRLWLALLGRIAGAAVAD